MYWKYFKYVIRHKWYVFLECCKVGIPFRGFIHDLSKFLPGEFIPYARYFYGKYIDIERDFDKAWLFHIHRNPHHWQYWVLREDDGPTKLISMPTKFLLEMLADWNGAGKAINGKSNTPEWYQKNKNNDNLSFEFSIIHGT